MPTDSDWLDLLHKLQSAYDPSLPDAAPKPPGYWATKQISQQGLGAAPGIGFGMLGSAFDKYTDEVPNRFLDMSMSGRGDYPKPQGLGDWLDSGKVAERVKTLNPLVAAAGQMAFDPLTYASFGS